MCAYAPHTRVREEGPEQPRSEQRARSWLPVCSRRAERPVRRRAGGRRPSRVLAPQKDPHPPLPRGVLEGCGGCGWQPMLSSKERGGGEGGGCRRAGSSQGRRRVPEPVAGGAGHARAGDSPVCIWRHGARAHSAQGGRGAPAEALPPRSWGASSSFLAHPGPSATSELDHE